MKRILIILLIVLAGCAVSEVVKESTLTPEQAQEANYVKALIVDAFNKRVQIFKWLYAEIEAGKVTEQHFTGVGSAILSQVQWAAAIKEQGKNNPEVVKTVDAFLEGCKKDIEGLKKLYDEVYSNRSRLSVFIQLNKEISHVT